MSKTIFAIGDRVSVKRNHYSRYDLYGEHGTVVDRWHDKIVVKIDNHTNGSSSKGVFYFKTGQLCAALEEGELMEGMKNVVQVRFTDDSKLVNYASFEDKIAVGDRVVCKTKHHGLAVAEVIEVLPPDENIYSREIVCVVDMSDYLARKHARERKAELKQKMDKRMEELQSMAIYEMLAEKDSELRGMLEEYKNI